MSTWETATMVCCLIKPETGGRRQLERLASYFGNVTVSLFPLSIENNLTPR